MTRETDNEAFVRHAQDRLGLHVDGWAGPVTWSRFDLLYPNTAAKEKKASEAAVRLIHSFESLKLTAYPDPGSKDGNPWTVGWGSTGPDVVKGTVWTLEKANQRFAFDIAKFESSVRNLAPDSTQSQFDALVSFAYNVGVQAFADSTLLRKHNLGDYAGAKAEFARWNKNDGKVMAGLTRRRAAEAAMYAS